MRIHAILATPSRYLLLATLLTSCLANTNNHEGHQQPLSTSTPSPETHLNITAILSSPIPPHHAYIRCLRSPLPFIKYPTIGSSLLLSNTSNMTLVALPASPKGEGEGWHHPPHPMWFVLLSGKARVWTPGLSDDAIGDEEREVAKGQEVWIEAEGERRNQIVLALDLEGKGHKTWYYGEEGSTVMALQLPLSDGWEDDIGRWEVVREGAC